MKLGPLLVIAFAVFGLARYRRAKGKLPIWLHVVGASMLVMGLVMALTYDDPATKALAVVAPPALAYGLFGFLGRRA